MNVPEILIERDFLDSHETLYRNLVDRITWNDAMSARRTASFGKPYDYSQMKYETLSMHPLLADLNQRLIDRLEIPFNNCLLNFYETGNNTMGFHSDDTTHLIPGTGVAIVSLGSMRAITYRSIEDRTIMQDYDLPPGSLLYMDNAVQQHWMHAIRRDRSAGPRISLTWRAICD